jgi:hypothetical protein
MSILPALIILLNTLDHNDLKQLKVIVDEKLKTNNNTQPKEEDKISKKVDVKLKSYTNTDDCKSGDLPPEEIKSDDDIIDNKNNKIQREILKNEKVIDDILTLKTEDTGKIFEMAICLSYNIEYDG